MQLLPSLLLYGASLGAMSVQAQDASPLADEDGLRAADTSTRSGLRSSVPDGFEELLEPMPVVVDVYFGGKLIGTTSGVQEPGHFTFDEPDAVIELISGIVDRAVVVEALSGRLDSNTGLVCGPSPRPDCGTLSPQVAGIIHDPMTFRLDIFIAPELLEVRQVSAQPFLPYPDADLSFISNFAGSVTGAEGRETNYIVQNRSILAWRNVRLRSELAQSSFLGFDTQIMAAEMDTRGLRWRGGLFWADGLAFTGQARIYGASVGSQFDTRARGESAYSRPIVVYLARRAKVNVYRQGRLLTSGLFEAGNQAIDTSYFPSGSYNVDIEIVEDAGATRNETQFFTKDRSLPPPGSTAFSAAAGVLARDERRALPGMGEDIFLQGKVGRRLTDNFALQAGGLLVGSDFVVEGGAIYLQEGFTARVNGLAGNNGNFGVIADVSWFDLRDFSVNGYVRQTWGPGFGDLGDPIRQGITAANNVNLLTGDSRQYGGNVTWRIGDANVRLTGFYFSNGDSDDYYVIGPSVDYAWRATRNTQLTMFADARRSSVGWDARVGLRITFNRDNFGVFGEVGGAYREVNGADAGDAVGSVLVTHSTPGVLQGDLSVAAGYARDLDSERVRGELSLDGQYGRLQGQVEHAFDVPGGGTRYAANFATSVALGGGEATIGGREIGESGILASLDGGSPNLEVQVLVDNAPRARLKSGQSVPIFLPPYRNYSVRLVPVAGAAGRLDTSARDVTLYSGNMASLTWTAEAVQAVYGRLVDRAGEPIRNAIITGTRDFMQTDDSGYFQGEIGNDDQLVVRQAGEVICAIEIPFAATLQTLVPVGDVTCARSGKGYGK